LARLQGEIDQALAGRTPTFADLPQLPYARMVFQEALRLYPPVAWLPRTAIADDLIDGYRIPAGATVVLPIYIIQQHPTFWPDAADFRPERFAPTDTTGTASAQHPFAWLPFGAGPRLCMGRDFALMEGQLVLAMVLQRFRFTPVADRAVMPRLTMAMAPKDGVWVRAMPQ
jgi:cytochrome P450